ncbi:hypothetical protein ACW2Q0_17030 [Nocardia sp. R16R-3T]
MQTLLEGDMLVLKLANRIRQREAMSRAYRRAEALRVEAMTQLRAERGCKQHRGGAPGELDGRRWAQRQRALHGRDLLDRERGHRDL